MTSCVVRKALASTALCWCGRGTKPDSSPFTVCLRAELLAAASFSKAARSACVKCLSLEASGRNHRR